MQIKKNIIFYFDSGIKIGSGHLGRCLRFSEYILNVKRRYKFYFISTDSTFKKDLLIQKKNFIHLKKKNLFKNLKKIIETLNPRYIFIDSYKLNFKFKQEIYVKYKNTIIIDDELKNRQIGKIYINYNYNALSNDQKKKIDFEKKFIGYKFFFKKLNLNKYKPKLFNDIKSIFIYLGSTKNTILLKNILEILSLEEFKNIDIQVVVGKYEKFNFQKKFKRSNFYFYKNLHNKKFLKLASKCQVAIGSGGVSCYERIYLGLVNLVIITAKNQTFSTNNMHKLKCVYKLGEKKHMNYNNLKKKIFMYLNNKKKIKNIYNNSSKILFKNETFKILSYLNL